MKHVLTYDTHQKYFEDDIKELTKALNNHNTSIPAKSQKTIKILKIQDFQIKCHCTEVQYYKDNRLVNIQNTQDFDRCYRHTETDYW